MRTTRQSKRTIRRAADAVVEYAIVSLQAEFLVWEKHVNLGVAELVWNAHSFGTCEPPAAVSSPVMTALIERLTHMRRTKWPDEKFVVLGLDVRHRHGDLLFRFDLTWDEGETFQPCEIAWDPLGVSPTLAN